MPRRSQIELKPNNNQQRLSREEISIFKRKFSEVAEDIDHPFRNIKLNYEELIKIVEEVTQKNIRNRSQKEMYNLFQFLEETNFEENMKMDLETKILTPAQLFFFASQFMKVCNYNKNDIIYYEGDLGETYYIIMKGEVSLFKLKYENREMNSREYYLFLYDLHLNSIDKMIINKIVKINKDIIPVYKTSDVSNFKDILFIIDLINLSKENDEKKVLEFFKENNKNPSDYKFDRVLSYDITMEEYNNEVYNLLSESEGFYFKNLKEEKKQIKICENELISNLLEKDYFGNFKMGNYDFYRTDTAKCSKDDTKILVINKKSCFGCITEEQLLDKEKEIDSIYQNSIFNVIRRIIFEKHYFYKLDLDTYSMGDNIIVEGDILDDIYVLKEGSVEINLVNKNIFDIKDLISNLKQMDIDLKKKNYDEYIMLNNPIVNLKNTLSEKKNYSLFKINTNECFGLFEFLYNNRKAIYNLKVLSDKAKIYKMNIDDFLLEKEGHIEDIELLRRSIKLEGKAQLEKTFERLIELKKSIVMKVDYEFSKKNNEILDNYYNHKFDIFSVKNNMRIVNNNQNINNHMKHIFVNKLSRNNHLENKKRYSLLYIDTENSVQSNSSLKRIDYSSDFIRKNNNTENLNQRRKLNQKSFINDSQNTEKDIYLNEVKFLKKQIKEDSELYFEKPNIEVPILPIIKGSRSIPRENSYIRLQKLSQSNSRINLRKSKDIRNIDPSNELFKSYEPNLNREKKINYLAIKEFYNKFNYGRVRNLLIKKDKFK